MKASVIILGLFLSLSLQSKAQETWNEQGDPNAAAGDSASLENAEAALGLIGREGWFGPRHGPGFGPGFGPGRGPRPGPGYGPGPGPGHGPRPGPGYGPGPGHGPYPPPPPRGQYSYETIYCASLGGPYTQCNFDQRYVVNVEFAGQVSRTRCEYRRNFGIERGFVWVQDGCRAHFRVTRYY